MKVIQVWGDVHCPWNTLAVARLRRARDNRGLDVAFDPRAWPLEWVNEQGTPRHVVDPETAVLAQEEADVFSAYRGRSYPSTMLPAFELIAAARRVGGTRLAEEVDWALRLGFFRDSRDISLRHELRACAEAACTEVAGADAEEVLRVWTGEPVRADVTADFAESERVPVQGSPQIVWPDGSTTHNPGVGGVEWIRGIPHPGRIDAAAPARLLAERSS